MLLRVLFQERGSLQQLIKEGAIGEVIWQKLQRAEMELNEEILEVISEAESYKVSGVTPFGPQFVGLMLHYLTPSRKDGVKRSWRKPVISFGKHKAKDPKVVRQVLTRCFAKTLSDTSVGEQPRRRYKHNSNMRVILDINKFRSKGIGQRTCHLIKNVPTGNA